MGKLGKLGLAGAAIVAGGLVYNAATAEGSPRWARETAEFFGVDDCARNLPNGPEVKACRRYEEDVLDVLENKQDAERDAAKAAAKKP